MSDIFIIIVLILLNGLFSMSEIALISARKSRLTADAKNGSRGARTALRLAEDPDRFLSTIQIGITLIGILTGLYSGAALAGDMAALLQRWGLPPQAARMAGQVAIVAVVTYLSIVIGELVPKRVGLAVANSVAKFISRPMHLLSVIAMPAVWLLSASTSLIVRLLGIRTGNNNVTEEEIKSLIKDGTDAGEVRKVEQNIMERALVLGDLRVSSIMTPKVDVASLRLGMTADQVRHQLSEELHSSYPVYCDSARNSVCGMVSLKKLILTLYSPGFRLHDVISEPVYFPESMNVYDALDHMKAKGLNFALVCDEFGDMAGVITPGDILDGLVGAIPQPDEGSDMIHLEPDGSYTIDARIPFYDFLSRFGMEDLYKPASYSTLGGFILEEMRQIPRPGESITWNGIQITVKSVTGAKIHELSVTIPDRGEAPGIP